MAPALLAAADVLVFTRTEAFRHDSIPAGVAMLQSLAATQGWQLTVTEDPAQFTAEALASFEVVVWLNTTGDVLEQAQQEAFAAWVEAGGGWLGIHAAADCEYDWAWYGALLGNGAWFHSHPQPQTAQVQRETVGPSTAHLPDRFSFHDEWYNFRGSPRGAATVLLSLDESSYAPGPGAMQDHPIAWRRQLGAGRAWYTGFGHRTETYADPRFTTHVAGGVAWLLGTPLDRIHANGFE
jgi:type 1 glutamine amidotransferase